MAFSPFVEMDGVRYAARCEPLSSVGLAPGLAKGRSDLEALGDRCPSRIRLAFERWPWVSFTERNTERLFGLRAEGLSPDLLGLLAADENGRMRHGGLCVGLHCMSKSPMAFTQNIRFVGSCLVASALRWSQETGFGGRANIPCALGPHADNPHDNPSVAYAGMGFVALPALDGVSWVEMEISEPYAETFIRRFDDGR